MTVAGIGDPGISGVFRRMMAGVTDPSYNVRREANTAKTTLNPPSPRLINIAFATTRSYLSVSISRLLCVL